MNINGLDGNQVQAMHNPIEGPDIIDHGAGRAATENERRPLSERRRLRRHNTPYQPMAVDRGPGESFQGMCARLSALRLSRPQVESQIGSIEGRTIEIRSLLDVAHTREDYADEVVRLGNDTRNITQQIGLLAIALKERRDEMDSIRKIVSESIGSAERLERLRDRGQSEAIETQNLINRCNALCEAQGGIYEMLERGLEERPGSAEA